MNRDEAEKLLGLRSGATASEVEVAFAKAMKDLENRIQRAPTPSLKEKYREKLKGLEEAWEMLEGDQDNLPSLEYVTEVRALVREEQSIRQNEPREEVKQREVITKREVVIQQGTSPVLAILLTFLLTSLAAGAGWYFGIERREEEALRQAELEKQDLIEKEKELEAKNEAEATRLEAEAAKKAKANADAKAEAARLAAMGPQDGQSWQNSLGMKFVPAGTTNVLFSVYDTRVKDFQAFVDATGYDATANCNTEIDGIFKVGGSWKNPGFSQGPEYPVVGVSWNDAKAFCQWLTDKEHKEGSLKPNQTYRLPADSEWSKAVGLDESTGGTPESKSGKIQGIYPWGTSYPPPADAGNYLRKGDGAFPSTSDISNADGYAYTSPVGTFKPNSYGLYDMGGNVWQWCEDWYDEREHDRVARGAAWDCFGWSNDLLASHRAHGPPDGRGTFAGFRVVVVVKPG